MAPKRMTQRRRDQLGKIRDSLKKMTPILIRHILTEQRRRRYDAPVHPLLMEAEDLLQRVMLYCQDPARYAEMGYPMPCFEADDVPDSPLEPAEKGS